MATSLQLSTLITSIFLIITTSTIDVVSATNDGSTSLPPIHDHSSISVLGPILTNLGFRELADALPSLSTTTTTTAWRGPITIFAPTDSSLLTCPSCSTPLLLQEHIVPGLFPLHYMRTLAFGTKIETLAPGRCITFTSSPATTNNATAVKIFVGGVEISDPDLFNDGLVVVHGLRGFVSHLSSLSCNVERMSSLSFLPPLPVPEFVIMRLMLKDAMLRLHIDGYTILALALRVKHSQLLNLSNMTVFALDDRSIFSSDGHTYLSDFRFHIVPNKLLMAADLEKFPPAAVLPTLEQGQSLVVTTAGGRKPSAPMRINYVTMKSHDLVYSLKIAVHGVSMPFPHIHPTAAASLGQIRRSRGNAGFSHDVLAPSAVIGSTAEIEDHHGL